MNDDRIAAFRVVPVIIAICAFMMPLLEVPSWLASLITSVATLARHPGDRDQCQHPAGSLESVAVGG